MLEARYIHLSFLIVKIFWEDHKNLAHLPLFYLLRIVKLQLMCSIITRGLNTFYPLFDVQKRFFKGLFFLKFWPYVCLVFMSSLYSRASYGGVSWYGKYLWSSQNIWTLKAEISFSMVQKSRGIYESSIKDWMCLKDRLESLICEICEAEGVNFPSPRAFRE